MINRAIQVVVVLYGMRAEQSIALRTFMQYRDCLRGGYHLCIYNNSTDIVVEWPEAEVVNATANDGLAKAYNFALGRARENGCQWLLLLDQDTVLTADYLRSLDAFVASGRTEMVAAVPSLIQNNIHMSPAAYRPWKGVAWRCEPVTASSPLRDGRVLTAFNSCSLLNVDKLLAMNGFNEEYPLDMLDHWMYHQFHRRQWRTCVLDCELTHSLSENTGMSLMRYRGYLHAHLRWAKEVGTMTALMFRLRMLLRWVQMLLRGDDAEKRKSTLRIIFR